MSAETYTLAIEYDTKWAVRLAVVALHLWPLIGRRRAQRLATRIACRLTRYRLGNEPWRRFPPSGPTP